MNRWNLRDRRGRFRRADGGKYLRIGARHLRGRWYATTDIRGDLAHNKADTYEEAVEPLLNQLSEAFPRADIVVGIDGIDRCHD